MQKWQAIIIMVMHMEHDRRISAKMGWWYYWMAYEYSRKYEKGWYINNQDNKMTVKELRDLLNKCDPDSEVVDTHGDDIVEIDDETDMGLVYLNV